MSADDYIVVVRADQTLLGQQERHITPTFDQVVFNGQRSAQDQLVYNISVLYFRLSIL